MGVDGFVCSFFNKGIQFLGDEKIVNSAVLVLVESFPGEDFAVVVSFSVRVN